MMKQMMKTACAIAVLAASANTMAADLVIKGSITPASCSANFDGGGVIDYGSINPNTLAADKYTVLPVKNTTLTLTCDAATKLGFKATNNRKGTIAGIPEATGERGFKSGLVTLNGINGGYVHGLGLADGKAIGGWGAIFTSTTVDDKDAIVISQISPSQYSPNTGNKEFWAGKVFSSSDPAKAEPLAGKVFSYGLQIQAYINKTSELDVTKPVALDGSATFDVVYL